MYGFNAELYHNMSEAQHKSQGLVAISLMVQVSERTGAVSFDEMLEVRKFRDDFEVTPEKCCSMDFSFLGIDTIQWLAYTNTGGKFT